MLINVNVPKLERGGTCLWRRDSGLGKSERAQWQVAQGVWSSPLRHCCYRPWYLQHLLRMTR
jgi:hypothetical protein